MRRLLASAAFCGLSLVAGVSRADDLAPPPPMAPPPPQAGSANTADYQQTATNQQLDDAEKKDSGRNFEIFWVDTQVGASYINMAQFSSDTLAIKKTSAGGPEFSVGAGFRLVVFVAGARLRYNALSSFNLWQINGEAGLKIPISSIDILFALHGGYSFVGSLGDANGATDSSVPTKNDNVSIRGLNAGLEFAIDYYVTPIFSVGGGVLGDFLYLKRPPVDKPAGFALLPAEQQAAITNDPLYKDSGSTAGLQIVGGLRLGLHLGL